MELLKELYKISSPSGNERKMKKFIKDWCKRNIEDYVLQTDNNGNMYIQKGNSETYPCVVAHLDEVHNSKGKGFRVIESEGIMFGFNIKIKDYVGIGADDKNGIWVALKCLKEYDNIKVAFFVEEERGCVGSSEADMSFFNDVRFVLQCDRKSGTDLITCGCGTDLASEEFLRDICYQDFGYNKENGSLSDVITLVENGVGVSCLNIGCGYYRPHTQFEFTVFPELKNCLNFVQNIIETCISEYPHEYVCKYQPLPSQGVFDKYYEDSEWDKYWHIDRQDEIEELQNIFFDYIEEEGFDIKDFIRDYGSQFPSLNAEDILEQYENFKTFYKDAV